MVIDLNVPSGEMVFSDGLPGFFVLGEYDVNTEIGTIKKIKAMERIGCAYAYIGNSCPIVYRIDGRNLLVAAIMSQRRKNKPEKIAPDCDRPLVVRICRCRGIRAAHRAEKNRLRLRNGGSRSIQVYPYAARELGCPDLCQNRLGSGTGSKKDYLAEYRAMDFTAGQVIRAMMIRWPRLFEGPNALMHAAKHIICTMDGGRSWHANGFPQFGLNISPEIEDMAIPVFDQPFDWYPMYEECAMVRAANEEIRFNPSFASLAKNVARCMIKHGSGRHTGNPQIAQECLAKLDILYPEA